MVKAHLENGNWINIFRLLNEYGLCRTALLQYISNPLVLGWFMAIPGSENEENSNCYFFHYSCILCHYTGK